MPSAADINAALADLVADGGRLNAIVNGDASTDVLLEDGVSSVPSVAKLFAAISNKWRSPARAATTGPLSNTPTYANGAAGFGATLTAATNGALSIDSVSPAAGDRVLVKDEAAQSHNGVYSVTAAGSVSTPYTLTRVVDADTSADLVVGLALAIQEGTTYGGATFVLSAPLTGSIAVGTDAIAFRTQASLISPATMAGILTGNRIAVSGNYAVPTTIGGSIIEANAGGQFQIQFGDPATYLATHRNRVENSQTNACTDIYFNGAFALRLCPGQSCDVEKKANGTWVIANGPGRYQTLGGGLTLWVAPAGGGGSDTLNDGFSSSRPFATMAGAYNWLRQHVDCCTFFPTLRCTAPGEYGTFFASYPLVGSAQMLIQGDDSSFAAASGYTFTAASGGNCIGNRDLATITVRGVKLQTTGNGAVALSSSNECNLDIAIIVFGNFPLGLFMSAGTHADINILDSLDFTGGAATAVAVDSGGVVQMTSFTHQIAAASFTTCFCLATSGGVVNGGCAFSGAGAAAGSTGQKYITATAGGINGVNGGWIIPGSVAGTVTSPGWIG